QPAEVQKEVEQSIQEKTPPSEQPAGANRTEAGESGAVETGVAAPETPQAITETTTNPEVTQTGVATPLSEGPGAASPGDVPLAPPQALAAASPIESGPPTSRPLG